MTNSPAPLLDPTRNDQPDLRASDSEREQAASLLRDHCAAGRLTTDELTDRLDQAYRARTLCDLAALLGDLPTGTARRAVAPRRRLASLPLARRRIALPAAWRSCP